MPTTSSRWASTRPRAVGPARLHEVLSARIPGRDFDYFLKIRVSDMADFNRMHSEILIALPGVRQTRTFFVMKEVIDNARLAL